MSAKRCWYARAPVLVIALHQEYMDKLCLGYIKNYVLLCVRGATLTCARALISLAVPTSVACNTPSPEMPNQQWQSVWRSKAEMATFMAAGITLVKRSLHR